MIHIHKVHLLSPDDSVREQAVWALGNIAGDSPMCRDLVLREGALEPLLQQAQSSEKIVMVRNATWTLFYVCVEPLLFSYYFFFSILLFSILFSSVLFFFSLLFSYFF